MHVNELRKTVPNMAKGLVLVTNLQKPRASSLILSNDLELSDIQRVVKVGPWVKDTFKEGDWVKINWQRFLRPKKEKQKLADGSDFDTTTMEYQIPVETFGGDDFLIIDQGDVEFYWDGK